MITSNKVKERIGINLVATMVEGAWESGWQEYRASNDDAIDGVILLRKGKKQPTDTGGLVFTQVKCGGNGYRKNQKQYPNHIGMEGKGSSLAFCQSLLFHTATHPGLAHTGD